MKKKFLIIFATIVIMSLSFSFGECNFSDVTNNDWFEDDLNYASDSSRNIIDGYPDGTFRPNGTLSVEQFIKLVISSSGVKYVNVEGRHWSEPYIERAIIENYISENTFTDYTKGITREEMAQIIASYIDINEEMESIESNKNKIKSKINDFNEIAINKQNKVLKSYEYGILLGYPDGSYQPQKTLTRAEGTAVIRRIIDKQARQIPDLESTEIEVIYHPETDTYEVDDSEFPLFEVDDYSQKEIDEDGWVNFSIIIDVNSRDEEIINKQREIAKAFLDKKVGISLSEEIMEYVSTKNGSRDNLKSTFYKWQDGNEVQVISYSGNALIQIAAWRRNND
ncbi:S-layer homology domain-containing protein [Clostridiaceae bacterium HSG29]|nr:S-layer homology domain-containing protein [Clostridiaceae bacterium HSG29]